MGTVYDLQLSQTLFDPNSWWAQFLADYGEFPGYICVYLAALSFSLKNQYRRFWQYLRPVIGSIVLFFMIKKIIISLHILDQTLLLDVLLYSVCLSISIILTLFLSTLPISPEFSRITLKMAIIFPLFFVQILKLVWGRVRFRNLTSDHSNFTYWFHPQGLNGNKSFPSGHVAMAWMTFPIIFLIPPTNKQIRFLVLILVLIWIFLVSLSRIIIGAHYLSDVVVSSLLGTQIFHNLSSRSTKS